MNSHNNLAASQFRRTALAISLGLSLGLMGTSALAQDAQSGQAPDQGQAKELSTVTVTGSRIHSVDVETAQPVFTVTQADIQKTGLVSVETDRTQALIGFVKANGKSLKHLSADLNNNFASLAATVNALVAALKRHGLMSS